MAEKDAIFYHLVRKNAQHQLNVGLEYFFGLEYNEFRNHLYTGSLRYAEKKYDVGIVPALRKYIQSVKNKKATQKDIQLLNLVNDGLYQQSMIIRELIFEEVRAINFPAFPSRMRGIWLIEPKYDIILYWMKTLGNCRLLRVKLNGKAHYGDNYFLEDDPTIAWQEYHQRAYCYWNGINMSKSREIIAEGIVSIEEEVDISVLLSHFKKK